VRYNRDVRPILAENCFACHGPDSASRKAGLRLDRRDDATAELGSGGIAIVAGDPDGSDLIARIEETDSSLIMPPRDLHKTINPAQLDTLRRWIAAGAEYEPHWSFLPPTRPIAPEVKNPEWVRNPIDRFILARIEAAGLSPAPEADRRTLARRASLDVTGLPPTPEEVQAFVDDPAPEAYERFVDRLLASPRWGENRARSWLDAARYADTHGYHFDNAREMWSYRDWVINAFNANMPYDRFAVEQLAGDLLPNATLDQQIASGFNRCNMTTNEGGTIPEENLDIYKKDRTDTTGQVFLGLTVGCAQCHDHKFDPLSQKEYYELTAFFNNTTQAAMDGNIRDTPPILVVPRPEDRAREQALGGELTEAQQALEARRTSARSEFDAWLAGVKPEEIAAGLPTDGLALKARLGPWEEPKAEPLPAEESFESADAGSFEKDQAFTVAAWVRPAKAEVNGAILARMEAPTGYRGWDVFTDNGRIVVHMIHAWDSDAIRVNTEQAPLTVNAWNHVAVTYDGSGKAAGFSIWVNGQRQGLKATRDTLSGTIRTEVPLHAGRRHGSDPLRDARLGEIRIYRGALPAESVAKLSVSSRLLELARLPKDARAADEVDRSFAAWLRGVDPVAIDLAGRVDSLQAEQTAIRARGTIAHVMHDKNGPAMANVLFRGAYDQPREEVGAGTPAALPPFPADAPRNRLGLAQWVVSADNPLAARVAVNRFWQEIFGAGIVRTPGDFGITGELPTHPELLDELAVDFRESGWDVKRLFRLMLTSATYRQSAAATPEKLEADPLNKLLARGPRFRMDAEVVRDVSLAASGLLAEKLGGPSVRPYQPEGVWEAVAMPESNTRMYRADTGESLHRRSLYTFWKRAAPPALMEIFNAPSRESCTVRRERTNTPLQALATLNDPTFVESARVLASHALEAPGTATPDRVAFMTERLMARRLRAEEQSVVDQSLAVLLEHYRTHLDDAKALLTVGEAPVDARLDPAELAAWTMLANQLMSLDEVLTK
jgi:hypothetical protein